MASPIAKLSRPALRGVVARPRLFAVLDRAVRRHAVAWIAAPAGSGKTTLVASYLEARRRRCLWYQLDERDADPATFFFYLREAARRLAPRRQEPLPLLTAEYALGLEAYAHHFFEVLGARLPPGCWLVLDNYESVPESAPLHRLLAGALGALPEATRLLALSRHAPPPPFARLLAEGTLGLLEPEALALTAGELRALARARPGAPLGAAEAERLRARTDGWAAGALLLLEAPGRPLPARRGAATAGQQLLFDYFAAELLERAPAETQRLLLATALLPELELATAAALSGEARAGELLADLVRRNLLTARLAGTAPRYRLHPLFREFLVERARRELGEAAWRAHAERAAGLLAAAGDAEGAARLLAEVGAHQGLAELLLRLAPALAEQGRLATLEGWLEALPAALRDGDPWLTYWSGVCSMADQGQARARFEAAYRAFRARSDVAGTLLAWAGAVNSYLFVWDDFRPLDSWLADMEAMRREGLAFPSVEIEAQVTCAMAAGLQWRRPAGPEVVAWTRRAEVLLDSPAPAELKIPLATHLLSHWLACRSDHRAAERLVARMRPLAEARDVRPVSTILWRAAEAAFWARTGVMAPCLAAADQGLELARKTGVLGGNLQVAAHAALGALAGGDVAAARRYVEAGEVHAGAGQKLSQSYLRHAAAWVELCDGRLAQAEAKARDGLGLVQDSGSEMALAVNEHTLGHVLADRGDNAQARALLERARRWSREVGDLSMQCHALLSLAWVALLAGDLPTSLRWLEEGLRLGREQGFVAVPWIGFRKDVMARLMALALEHGLEVEHVLEVIRLGRLVPPPGGAPASWPWSVRVRLLGTFELQGCGGPVTFGRKVPKKTIELLQALALRAGAAVPDRALADLLWPDADGDAAQHSLRTALYRLRRLLEVPEAVSRAGGALALDGRCCWTDLGELARRLNDAARLARTTQPDAALLRRAVNRAADLYRGPLLPQVEAPWAVEERARLRRRVGEVLLASMPVLTQAGEGAAGEAALDRVHAADPDLGAPRQRRA